MSDLRPPRPLASGDVLDRFTSRSAEQTSWLRHHARQSVAAGATKVFVVTTRDDVVVAYYAWRMAELAVVASPSRLRKGAGRYPQPVALLARLAVDARYEGRGIGAALLLDVIGRMVELSADIGCRGLLIHAETPTAREYYLHLLPELLASPTDPLHLVLLAKDARRTLLG